MISELNHVQITVEPEMEEQTIAWYRDVLGLQEIEKPAALKGNGGAWFKIGGNELHVSRETGVGNSTGSKRHICYVTPDLDAARNLLVERGIEIIEDHQPVDEWVRFYLRDPAGNRLEIAQRL